MLKRNKKRVSMELMPLNHNDNTMIYLDAFLYDDVKEAVLKDLCDLDIMIDFIRSELINIRMTSENKMILNSINYINLHLDNHKKRKKENFGDFSEK